MNTYAPGSAVVLSFAFATANNVPTDPTAATIEVLDPTGTLTPYDLTDLTRLGTGSYTLTILVHSPGKWRYKASATGSIVVASLDQSFWVEASSMP